MIRGIKIPFFLLNIAAFRLLPLPLCRKIPPLRVMHLSITPTLPIVIVIIDFPVTSHIYYIFGHLACVYYPSLFSRSATILGSRWIWCPSTLSSWPQSFDSPLYFINLLLFQIQLFLKLFSKTILPIKVKFWYLTPNCIFPPSLTLYSHYSYSYTLSTPPNFSSHLSPHLQLPSIDWISSHTPIITINKQTKSDCITLLLKIPQMLLLSFKNFKFLKIWLL